METFGPILFSIWREVGQHIEIDECARTVFPLVTKEMPVERLLLRRIEPESGCVDTVAALSGGPAIAFDEARTACPPDVLRKVEAWGRRGCVAHLDATDLPVPAVGALLAGHAGSDVLVGPLATGQDVRGVLMLVAPAGERFGLRHEALAQALLDPFCVALENDERLHEIAALKEAAEADNRSLLTRLGRRRLGDTIVGAQTGLARVMERVEQVAESSVPVLIFGETGTGKELVARAIHNRSARHDHPFIRVNCGAIPPDLIDSELFGHERGAFTGAVKMRPGWFERADRGTLFLDEIGDLPPAAQVRLLRVLQDGWLERVGGHQPIHVDVRIVGATHQDLAAMVADGRFREDLWYRLAVFPIVLPPLRERLEDIPALARHLAERAATRFGLAPVAPAPEDVALLASYVWPGNVRELASVIDRAAILGEGETLEIDRALGAVEAPRTQKAEEATAKTPPTQTDLAPLDAAIRKHIETALAATRGRIEGPHGCARLLDINPNTLRARMRKLGIDWRAFRRS